MTREDLLDVKIANRYNPPMSVEQIPDWMNFFNGAITVTDENLSIIYANEKARKTWASYGEILGKNLLDCHNPHSQGIIKKLLNEAGKNVYTIEKNGVKKLIYQEAWKKQDGTTGGLIELSLEIPFEMNHFIRS